MSSKWSIHEVLKRAVLASDVELIDVPVAGEKIALMRVRSMPEFAFVMWVDNKTTTQTQIAFILANNKTCPRYPVVCACCSSETCGLDAPKDESKSDEWRQSLKQQFKEALVAACRVNGISTIFMRRAHRWGERYGAVEELAVVEAAAYMDAYGELYGRKPIRIALRFIDQGYTTW